MVFVSTSPKAGQAAIGTAAAIQPVGHFCVISCRVLRDGSLKLGESGSVLYNLAIYHSFLSTLYTFPVTPMTQSCARKQLLTNKQTNKCGSLLLRLTDSIQTPCTCALSTYRIKKGYNCVLCSPCIDTDLSGTNVKSLLGKLLF